MLLKPVYMRGPPADYQLNTADADMDDGVTILQPSVKLLRTDSPPIIYDQICKQCGCEFKNHLSILMLYSKVRSPSSGSLQKLHSGNRCPELRTWTWKETKHAHYSFRRDLRGDRIGNQNTLKVSSFFAT